VPRRLKPVSHEERLPLVEHLDELRSRLVFSLIAFGVAFTLCFWQSDLILELVNRPLEGSADRVLLGPGGKPITLGVTEQFTTTIMVSAYAGLLLSLPVLLFQAYAFVLPAFSPTERKVALPLLLMVPFLFVGGVLFGYFIVLEPAIDFLLGFNADEFTTGVRARDYYGFVGLSLIALGLLFQVPVGILGATRLGVVTPEGLRRNRRYAILLIAILAALLPTIDPVTLLLEMIPLVVLYELSILLARAFGRPRQDVSEPLVSPESP
jgi:sec-independent protein translocase protein TatC